ncbi:WD40/YVTN repeat-like-containing domain,WD40 repeat, conserved site [Cinara cedri]|uniref:WD40/YVTN repeat-like-containing domain,WD40 repeat, conserved site n=1 Tax=Cinara cedri TaxID=506608 RepID=A0A5E4MCX9_9HEMI|nr:WD40/YVTN repeat-like-containing domain,WD40 repeat, conserved site [Cinara cedri]
MFRYSRDSDRFVPDRSRDLYSFRSVDRNYAPDHQCVCLSPADSDESGFLESFECERRDEQQRRAYRQLEAYMSPELNGGHLLRHLRTAADDENGYKHRLAAAASDNLAWPVRMVGQRSLARKTNVNSPTYAADLLLDMPNLTDCWRSKILDWSSTGYLTAAIESSIHLWSCRSQSVRYKVNAEVGGEPADVAAESEILCLKWDARGEILAYSFTVDVHTHLVHGLRTDGLARPWTAVTNDTDIDTIISDGVSVINSSTYSLSLSSSSSSSFSSSLFASSRLHGYIKVWLLNGQKDGSNREQKPSKCSCSSSSSSDFIGSCWVTVMDWFSNGRVLVTGCNRVTITFFKYDHGQRQLIALSAINGRCNTGPNTSITGLYVSLDRQSRHVAFSTFSSIASVLTVWRIENPPEHGHLPYHDRPVTTAVNVNRTMADRYGVPNKQYGRNLGRACWLIQACAWHPWKHSLICYAVTTGDFGALLASDGNFSWIVLANACNGVVLKRVEQTFCYPNCPSVLTLSVVMHSMTFSRITGELLVSATRAYKVQKNGIFGIVKKHSVVVMHALNKIVETLSSSTIAKGLFFAWSPDGTQIAMTCSDQSLRIWNFWPTAATQRKSPDYRLRQTDSVQPQTISDLLQGVDDGGSDLNTSRERSSRHINNNNYCYQSNHIPTMMSELSLDASRVIK